MINCDAVKLAILEKEVAEFFSRLMLSYSISTNHLYNILHYVEFGVDPNYCEDDVLYDRKYNMERSNRRINRIAARIKADRSPGNGSVKDYAGAIYESMYYDSIMFKGMIRGYNRLCQPLGRPKVKIITPHFMRRAGIQESDERCVYDDHLVKCGYCVDIRNIERKFVTLPEAIFYTAMYMSTSSRALWTLNRPLIKGLDYNRALHWYDKFMEEFKKRTIYEAIIWEVFDMLFEEVAGNYEELSGYCIQKFWLEEKYRDRKDRARVLRKLERITYEGETSRTYLDKQLEAHPERSEDFVNTSNRISIQEMLLYDILPYAEMIALGRLSKPSNKEWSLAEKDLEKFREIYSADSLSELSPAMYENALADYEVLQYREVAATLANIVCKIVDESYVIVEKMLHGLPESIAWRSTE